MPPSPSLEPQPGPEPLAPAENLRRINKVAAAVVAEDPRWASVSADHLTRVVVAVSEHSLSRHLYDHEVTQLVVAYLERDAAEDES